jgi:hypothetical protein
MNMYCITCGFSIDDKHKFCANCGVVNPKYEEPASQIYVEPTDEIEITADEIPLPDIPPETENRTFPASYEYAEQGYYEKSDAPIMPAQSPPREIYFFGKKALVFCLTVIGILSVTAAMFMRLYLGEIGLF